MLLTLFLLFCLNAYNGGVKSAGEIIANKDNTVVLQIIEHKRVADSILLNLEEKDSLAYLNRDSIPILAPIKPIEIQLISSDYGWRIHPIYKDTRHHHGIDIAAPIGTHVFSTAEGIVIKAEMSKCGYGNEIIIQHGNDYKTRYAHLDTINVVVGQSVTNGTVIGAVGVTGLTTGPHLHYEVLKNNKDIDPMFFTYKDKKERSISKYNSTLIALETI